MSVPIISSTIVVGPIIQNIKIPTIRAFSIRNDGPADINVIVENSSPTLIKAYESISINSNFDINNIYFQSTSSKTATVRFLGTVYAQSPVAAVAQATLQASPPLPVALPGYVSASQPPSVPAVPVPQPQILPAPVTITPFDVTTMYPLIFLGIIIVGIVALVMISRRK